MKTILLVFGTRPEAIKMCPLVKELQTRKSVKTVVCVTGQHREMLDQVLSCFNVKPDIDLGIMKDSQDLFDISIAILEQMRDVLEKVSPDVVLVHGDTSTSFAAALSCFYKQIPVGHIEAGLRTYNLNAPFPEEFNRQSVGIIANYHFSPTKQAAENLYKEGKKADTVFVTGNTVIDALKSTVKTDYQHPLLNWVDDSRLILLTAHRRENLGEPLYQMFRAMENIIKDFEDVKVIYPIHLNPCIRTTAKECFGNENRIKIVEPMGVLDFHNFLNKSYLVLTDSGGIQEEASSLGKPVLVMRNTTERPEGIASGTLKLVGNTQNGIYKEISQLLCNQEEYDKMSHASNPYGDGFASKYITDILLVDD